MVGLSKHSFRQLLGRSWGADDPAPCAHARRGEAPCQPVTW